MRLLLDREIYDVFTRPILTSAHEHVWIATANIKATGLLVKNHFVSFVDMMSMMIARGVSFRLIHAELPSAPFRERYEKLDARGALSSGVEFLQCIRMHAKIFIVDGRYALVGSSNLTGAGIGAKSQRNRNFEVAFLFEGADEVSVFVDYFDYVWMGGHCPECGRRALCPAPAA
jgi:phosphatidylserine/phosphatidylglycerophosphate/cardiolipin synthase-like enzyme